MSINEYAEFLVSSICSEPEMVRVETFVENDVTILEIMVPESDMGAVIGKGGKVANSIRVMIQAYAYLQKIGKVRVNIESF